MTEDLGRVRSAIMRGRRVYLGNLSSRATERDVKKFFRDCGSVDEVILKNGFAFVEFASGRDAADAVKRMDGRDLLGGRVLVQFARVSRSIAAADVSSSGYRMLIDNLSSRVSNSEFRKTVEKYGTVQNCEILGDRRAVVEYRHRSDLSDALKKLDGKELCGRKIRVFEDRLNPSRSRSRERRRRDRSSSKSKKRRSRSRSHSRSKSRSRSASAKRSGKRSHSRSSDRGAKDGSTSSAKRAKTDDDVKVKKDASKSRSRSRSASHNSRSRSALKDKAKSKSKSASKSKSKSKSKSRSSSKSSEKSADGDKSDAGSANGDHKRSESESSDD